MIIGCIIQARMGSTRLPGKVMMKIDKKNSVLHYVITQVKHCKLIHQIIIATTHLKEDEGIIEFSRDLGIDYFRGEPLDVLDRYYQCAKKFSISTIVRVTSDNPLVDPEIIDQVIEKFNSNSYDYVSTSPPRSFPQGTDVEVFSFSALEKAWRNAKKPSEREHVTPYFYNNPNIFNIFIVNHLPNISHLRWTVDRTDDLELVRMIASKVKKRPILMKDIINLLTTEPNLIEINKDHIVDEGLLKSLKEDEKFLKSERSSN